MILLTLVDAVNVESLLRLLKDGLRLISFQFFNIKQNSIRYKEFRDAMAFLPSCRGVSFGFFSIGVCL